MFGSLGLPEILFIAVVALLVFGPRRLPEIGRTMGRFLGEFRRATSDLKRTIDTEVTLEEVRRAPAPPLAPVAAAKPAEVDPDGSEPASAERANTEPVNAESTDAESTVAEPADAGPAGAGHAEGDARD